MPDLVIRTEKTPLDRETLFRGVQPRRQDPQLGLRRLRRSLHCRALPPDPDEDAGSRRRSSRTARGRVVDTGRAREHTCGSQSLNVSYSEEATADILDASGL